MGNRSLTSVLVVSKAFDLNLDIFAPIFPDFLFPHDLSSGFGSEE